MNPRRFRKSILWVSLIAVIAVLTTGVLFVARSNAMGLVYRERKALVRTADELEASLPGYEAVSFVTADDLTLQGWFVPPASQPGPLLILMHGFGENREIWFEMSDELVAAGYGLLLFDARNHGISEGVITTMGYSEIQDFRAATDYALTRPEVDPDRIALIGHSMGAVTVLMAAPDIPEARVIVAISPFSSLEQNVGDGVKRMTGLPPFPFAPLVMWFTQQETQVAMTEIRPIDRVAAIAPRPLLLMHGELDETLNVSNSEALFAAAAEPKTFYVIPGGDHSDIVRHPVDDTIAQLLAFLGQVL